VRQLMRDSGVGQHAVERYLDGERVHPSTRVRILAAIEKLGRREGKALGENQTNRR
jgi:DNA-binding LacI/PurR family transcriptional regulator